MASRGVNKVILVGNCGQDPETKYMPSGGAVTNISVATSETWKDKQTGQPQERTEWHRVVFFNRLAENVSEKLQSANQNGINAALVTNTRRRRFLRTVMRAKGIQNPVFSFEEIGLDAKPALVGTIAA